MEDGNAAREKQPVFGAGPGKSSWFKDKICAPVIVGVTLILIGTVGASFYGIFLCYVGLIETCSAEMYQPLRNLYQGECRE